MAEFLLPDDEKALIPSLSPGQRAMRAARIATRPHGNYDRTSIAPTLDQAAAVYGVTPDLISMARKVLFEGTEQEIKEADAGTISVSSLARRLRQKLSPEERTLKNLNPNADRVETMRERAAMWGKLRDALKNISSLPRPADLVLAIRSNDKAKVTQTTIGPSIKWLQELEQLLNGEKNGSNGSGA